MNRINRLTAILIHLQTKRIIRAKEIAERFAISIRTVYRDIRALEDAGVPIGAQTGEGYFIVEGYHLPPVMFTKDEAGALLIGGKLIDMYADISVKTHFESSLYKIKSVLNSSDKEYLDNLNMYIEVLKAPQSIRDGFPDNLLSELQSVLGQKKVITINYHSGYKDEFTSRAVEPLGLCFYGSKWHLIAYCRLRKDYRDFRVDRIKKITEEGLVFDPENHDSLKDLVEKIVISPDLKLVVVRFDQTTAKMIREIKYYYGFVDEKGVGDQVEMNFLVPGYSYFAGWLLSFLDTVEVVSPKTLITLMRKYSEKLLNHYKPHFS